MTNGQLNASTLAHTYAMHEIYKYMLHHFSEINGPDANNLPEKQLSKYMKGINTYTDIESLSGILHFIFIDMCITTCSKAQANTQMEARSFAFKNKNVLYTSYKKTYYTVLTLHRKLEEVNEQKEQIFKQLTQQCTKWLRDNPAGTQMKNIKQLPCNQQCADQLKRCAKEYKQIASEATDMYDKAVTYAEECEEYAKACEILVKLRKDFNYYSLLFNFAVIGCGVVAVLGLTGMSFIIYMSGSIIAIVIFALVAYYSDTRSAKITQQAVMDLGLILQNKCISGVEGDHQSHNTELIPDQLGRTYSNKMHDVSVQAINQNQIACNLS